MGWYHLDYSFILIFTWISMQPFDNLVKSCTENKNYSIEAPENVTVQRGLCVHIPCRFTVPADKILKEDTGGSWFNQTKDNWPPVASNHERVSESTKGRFFLTGEVWKGDCSLSIHDAVPADASFYLFRLKYSNNFSYCRITPTVVVTELTDLPEISQEKTLMAGKEVTLTCTSPGRCNGSAPLITWSGVQGKNITYQKDYLDGNRTYYSNFTFTPSKGDHKSPLSCTVTFQRSNATTSQKIYLNVEYPPHINITIKGNNTTEDTLITVLEGDSLVIECIVDSNPQANISWHHKDSLLHGPLNGKLLTYNLSNIESSDAGRYQCSAQNNHWIRNRTIDINVHYVPGIPKIICATNTDCSIIDNYMIHASEGSTLSLICSADGSPKANLVWMKSDTNISEGLSTVELTVANGSIRDEGQYICQASNIHGSSRTNITIEMIRKTLSSSYTTIIIAIVCAILIVSVLLVKDLIVIQYYRKKSFKQIAEKKTECSTNCKEIYRNTRVSFNGGFKSEGMPEENRAPADEENECHATIIFPQLKTRASVEVKIMHA